MDGIRWVPVACVSLLAALSLGACGQKPTSIEVEPAAVDLFSADEKVAVKARVLDAEKKPIADARVVFTSSDAQVVTVTAGGELSPKKSGQATLTAAIGELKHPVPVTVRLHTTLKVAPERWEARVGDLAALKAEVANEAGEPIGDAVVTWASSDENVARVDATGNVTAVAPGEATITATSRALRSTTTVVVASAGASALEAAATTFDLAISGTARFVVQGVDAAGGPVTDLVLTYVTSDETVATVEPDGTITGVAAGTATITATEPAGKTITATVTVQ